MRHEDGVDIWPYVSNSDRDVTYQKNFLSPLHDVLDDKLLRTPPLNVVFSLVRLNNTRASLKRETCFH